MGKSYRKILGILSQTVALLLVGTLAVAQTVVTGKVTDTKDNSPVAGVNVLAKGTRTIVQTGADGSYRISVPANVSVLVFTSSGYTRQEVAIGGRSSLNVQMVQNNQQLNEVVVIGYGSQRRKEVTGAIAKVGGDKLTALPTPSFEASLQGRVAGVQVSQSSGLSGGASYVRIRGIASVSAGGEPLFVIDGIPVTSDPLTYSNNVANGNNEYLVRQGFQQNPLASINPNDIESVEVLKDAGAAGIYGSRGANGVILITTKRGKSGKPKFNFSSKVGFSTPSVKPAFVNGAEWVQLRQEAWTNDGNTGFAPMPNNINRTLAAQTNTDWFDELTRVGVLQDYNLSVTYGKKIWRTFLGGSFSDDQSYAVGNSFRRYGIRNNNDFTFSSKFKASLNLGYNIGINNRVPTGWSGGIGAAMSNALPIYPVKNADGSFYNAAGNGNNPLYQIDQVKARSIDKRFIGGLVFDYTPIKNLVIRLNGNADLLRNDNDRIESALWRNAPTAESRRFWLDVRNYNANLTATYNYQLNSNNKFVFLAGTEYQYTETRSKEYYLNANVTSPFWKDKASLDSAIITYGNQNAGRLTGNDRLIADRRAFASYFGRVNYAYKNKLFLQALARVDGSNVFGPNNRFGFFPAVSAAYVMSEEAWFEKALPFVNQFKVRASYGITGNANIPTNRWIGTWTVQQAGNALYNGAPIAYPNNFENRDLKWETAQNYDLGLEFGLFNNRLSGDVSYYNKLSKDVIMNQFVSNSGGYGNNATYFRNLGRVLNEGVEMSLNAVLVKNKDLTVSVNFNAANNYNEVQDVQGLGPDAIQSGTNETRILEGYPLGSLYSLQYMGADPTDGLPIWLDKNGNTTKQFSLDNRRPVGKLIPDWTGGFGANIQYKGFELNTLFVYAEGLNVWDNSGKFQFQGASTQNWNFRRDFLDRWTKPGDQARYPRLYYNQLYPGLSAQSDFSSSMFMYEGDYLRMRELTLAYRLPARLLQKLKLSAARVYATGFNLFLWTKYPNGDPEVNRDADGGQTDRNMSPNVTYLTPPQARSFTFGINVSF
jgi:TonB-dependent starch-binding outer membrane protein SusC